MKTILEGTAGTAGAISTTSMTVGSVDRSLIETDRRWDVVGALTE
jgi:hypothetical protein